jgi:hypothetical protein
LAKSHANQEFQIAVAENGDHKIIPNEITIFSAVAERQTVPLATMAIRDCDFHWEWLHGESKEDQDSGRFECRTEVQLRARKPKPAGNSVTHSGWYRIWSAKAESTSFCVFETLPACNPAEMWPGELSAFLLRPENRNLIRYYFVIAILCHSDLKLLICVTFRQSIPSTVPYSHANLESI